MVTTVELGVVLVAIVLLLGGYRVINAITPLIANAVGGLFALVLAAVFGFGVEITPIVLLIVAIGGIPGAILVVVLAYLGVAFVPVVL